MRKVLTTEEFIQKAKTVHNDKYDYSKTVYVKAMTKICIKCPIHGDFIQTPNNHINVKQGCPKCGVKHRPQNKPATLEQFIKKAKQAHGNKYDYSTVLYVNNSTKVQIICYKHGAFWQAPDMHTSCRTGCPKCCESTGESFIRVWLEQHNINFLKQKTFRECVNPKTNKMLKFDFYLTEKDTCIEYDGIQHFIEGVGRGVGGRHITTENEYIDTCYKDNIKNEFCCSKNIKLIRIKYDQNIETILMKEVNNGTILF